MTPLAARFVVHDAAQRPYRLGAHHIGVAFGLHDAQASNDRGWVDGDGVDAVIPGRLRHPGLHPDLLERLADQVPELNRR